MEPWYQVNLGTFWAYFDVDAATELLIGLGSLSLMFPRKRPRQTTAFRIAVTAAVFVALKFLIDFECRRRHMDAAVSFYIYIILLVLFPLIYAAWTLEGDRRQFAVVILFFVNNCVMITTIARYGAEYEADTAQVTATPQSTLFSCILLIAVMSGYKAVTRQVKLKISHVYWFIVILTPLIIMVIWQLFYGRILHAAFIILPLLFIVLDFVVYLLFMRLTEELGYQMELELANQSLALQVRQMEDIESLLENTRRQRHELKNNYFLIDSLLEQGQYDEIRTQLHEVIFPQFEVDQLVSTGNRFVDMLLSQKRMEAMQYGIPIVLDVRLSERIDINQQMLCSLVSNLLDNAIEASIQTCEPHIVFYMRQFKGYISIDVRNKIDRSVLDTNPGLSTSKGDWEHHGLGLKIIRQIVDCCDGNIKIFEENGIFVVTAILSDSHR